MALRLCNSRCINLLREVLIPLTVQPSRNDHSKHWHPKWKSLRREKVMKVELPKFRQDNEDLTEEQMRSKLKENGMLPPRPWNEKPFFLSSTGGIFEAYIPPEGDGKVSPIQVQGAKQTLQFLEKKTKTKLAIRKIRSYDEDFDPVEFCKNAEKIYIKMHELMAEKNWDNITDYITERAYPEVVHNIENKTIRWKFIKNIELPRIVHARCTHLISNDNIFGQITVRFNTQQMLAVYDRFGRLMHGSEIIGKDVIEFIVFESHLANVYGKWRIHAKIIPDWLPPKQINTTTYARRIEVDEITEAPPVEKVEEPKQIENSK